MRLTNLQLIVIAGSVALFIILVILGPTKPRHKKGDESSSAADSIAPLNDEAMLAGARNSLDSSKLVFLADLERQRAEAKNLDEELLVLKLMSRTWNEFGNFSAGGYYAQKVAELKPSGEAWAIAGSTFGIAFNKEAKDPALKKYLGHKAINAFQQAITLEPDTLAHAINEAIMYVELSMVDPKVMPMTGAQKMLALDKKHPDNININMQLGRLSFTRSGDTKKAIPRFEKVLAIAEKSEVDKGTILEAHFSLAECYKQENNKEKVLFHYGRCLELTKGDERVQAELKAAIEKFEKEGK